MKYIIDNFADGEWWRFVDRPFDTREEATERAELLLATYPNDNAQLRVREFPPAEQLVDAILGDIGSHRLARLEALISAVHPDTVEHLLRFYETDAAPSSAGRGHDGNESPSTVAADI